jgi:hypothetical protein
VTEISKQAMLTHLVIEIYKVRTIDEALLIQSLIDGIESGRFDSDKSEYQRGWDAAMAQSDIEPIAQKMVRDFERKKE